MHLSNPAALKAKASALVAEIVLSNNATDQTTNTCSCIATLEIIEKSM